MARKGPELCMFCGMAPCECEGQAKAKPKRQRAKPKAEPKSEGSGDASVSSAQGSAGGAAENFAALLPAGSGKKTERARRKGPRKFGQQLEPTGTLRSNEPADRASQQHRRRVVKSAVRPLEEHRAIQALSSEGLLHPSEQRRFADVVHPPLSGALTKYLEGGDYDESE